MEISQNLKMKMFWRPCTIMLNKKDLSQSDRIWLIEDSYYLGFENGRARVDSDCAVICNCTNLGQEVKEPTFSQG